METVVMMQAKAKALTDDFTEKDWKFIATFTKCMMVGMFVLMMLSPVLAAEFTTSYEDAMNQIFKIIRSLFASTACVVILISLFLILIGTGDSDVQKGIHRIKICIGCVIASFLVSTLITTIIKAVGNLDSGGVATSG